MERVSSSQFALGVLRTTLVYLYQYTALFSTTFDFISKVYSIMILSLSQHSFLPRCDADWKCVEKIRRLHPSLTVTHDAHQHLFAQFVRARDLYLNFYISKSIVL